MQCERAFSESDMTVNVRYIFGRKFSYCNESLLVTRWNFKDQSQNGVKTKQGMVWNGTEISV